MSGKEIRWKQRFENMQKAVLHLENALKIENPSEVEKAGGVQFFEMAFELTWKTLKDYLENEGFVEMGPRDVLKKSFEIGIIVDGEMMLKALKDRNLTTYLYNEEQVNEISQKIKVNYFPAILEVKEFLDKEYDK